MPLKLTGKPELKARMIARLKKCSGGKLKETNGNLVWDGNAPDPATPFSRALDDAIKSDKLVPLKLEAKPPKTENFWFDEFCLRTVYLDHIDALPEDPPTSAREATTRCETLIHILVEYRTAAEAGQTNCTAGFEAGHRAGFDAQKDFRRAKGQGAPKDQTVDRNGRFIFVHGDDSQTTARKNDDGGLIVEQVPAPEKNKETTPKPDQGTPKPSGTPSTKTMLPDLFEHATYRFTGTIQSLGPRASSWSSLGISYQRVTYRLDDNLGAALPGDFIDVQHPLVQFSASAEAGRPGLSRRHFAPGRKQLVLADLAADPEGCLVLRAATCELVIAVIERTPRPSGQKRRRGMRRASARRG